MDCKQAKNRFSLYMDKIIPEGELSLFRAHIDNCFECSSEISQIRKAITLLKDCKDFLLRKSCLTVFYIFLIKIYLTN